MKSFKVFIQVFMLAAVVTSVTACSKSGSKSNVTRGMRQYNPAGGSAPGVNAVSCNNNTYTAMWGEIIGFDSQSISNFFGSDASDVSNQSNQATGVRFYGAISSATGIGNVVIRIYKTEGYYEDSYSCNGVNQGGLLVISCQDQDGYDLVLSGTEQNNQFGGQVSFNNRSASLGQFRISSCGFFTN